MKYLNYIFVLLLFTSCDEVIDLELEDSEKILVVEGNIGNHDSSFVKLSYTTNYFDNNEPDYTVERGAEVLLYENESLVDTMAWNEGSLRFETDHVGIVNNEYHVEITTSEGLRYSSEIEKINRNNPIDTAYTVFNPNTFLGPAYEVYITTQEPEGTGDYYQWKIYINGEYQAGGFNLLFADDGLVDGNLIADWNIFIIPEQDYFEYAQKDPDGKVKIRIEQLAITQGYYNFLRLLQEQTLFVGGPFAPPPAEIEGNVESYQGEEDRPLGYLFSSNVESGITVIEP